MNKYTGHAFIILVFLALAVRLITAPYTIGYGGSDLNCYEGWSHWAAYDFVHVYPNAEIDYPPAYIYVLFFIGKALPLLNGVPGAGALLLKIPAIIADIVSGIFIYRIAGKRTGKASAMAISALYLFNPAVFVNSSMWGQTDSILTLIIVLALYYLMEERIAVSTFFFALACMLKWQGFIFLLILLLELIRRMDWKKFVTSAAIGFGIVALIVLPFTLAERDIFWIFRLLASSLGKYSFATVHAFNAFFLMRGDLVEDSTVFLFLPFRTWSLIFTAVIVAFVAFLYLKSKSPARIFISALVLQSCIFMFTARMHERYWYPAVLLLVMAFVYCRDRRFIPLYIWLSAIVFLNHLAVLYCSHYLDDADKWLPYFNAGGFVISIIGLCVVIYLIRVSRDILLKDRLQEIG